MGGGESGSDGLELHTRDRSTFWVHVLDRTARGVSVFIPASVQAVCEQ